MSKIVKVNDKEHEVTEQRLAIGKQTVNIPLDLEFETDFDYSIAMIVSIEDCRLPTNHDGTYKRVWVAKPTGEIAIHDKFKKKCYTKKRGSYSQRWFRFIENQNTSKMDDREFYEAFMEKMLNKKDKVFDIVCKD